MDIHDRGVRRYSLLGSILNDQTFLEDNTSFPFFSLTTVILKKSVPMLIRDLVVYYNGDKWAQERGGEQV